MFQVVRDHNTDVRNKTYAQQNPSQTELDRFAMDNDYTPYKQHIVEKNPNQKDSMSKFVFPPDGSSPDSSPKKDDRDQDNDCPPTIEVYEDYSDGIFDHLNQNSSKSSGKNNHLIVDT